MAWMFKQWRLLAILTLFIISTVARSEGYVGKRFFPSTIVIESPFISDKLALTYFRTEAPGSNGGDAWTSNPRLQYALRVTKRLQLSINASYLHVKNPGHPPANGFNDWQVGAKYNFARIPSTESIFSVSLNSTIGGTGSPRVGANSHTTLSPQLLYAQGFGIYFDAIKFLRPLAIGANVGPNIVTNNYTVTSINWGFAIEYSFLYLDHFIYQFKIPLINSLVPVIEIPLSTCTQGSCSGQTTGNVDPGIIYVGRYGQFGIEAIIPINSNTGSKIGGVAQLYLYLDNIFPSLFSS